MSGVTKMQSQVELSAVEERIKAEFPDFQVLYKDSSWLMLAIDRFLRVITFGQMTKFLTHFTTTIGTRVYVTREWTKRSGWAKAATLRHEQVHMRQRRYLGAVWYSLSYLFWVFPIGLAWGRCRLEREAYEESLLAYAEYYGANFLKDPKLKHRIVSHFTGPDYFWMWPFHDDCSRWYDRVVAKLVAAEEASHAQEGQHLQG